MANVIGIDLGTTNSVVAILDEAGRPLIVADDDGDRLTPSVVFFEGKGNSVVGKHAKTMLGIDNKEDVDSGNLFKEFKRVMGSTKTFKSFGDSITPTNLSAIVLKKLKEVVEGSHGNINQAVVTIPANFDNEAREATISASIEAGLEVQNIINEPTAAALYYAYQSQQDLSGTFVVYDLGGGTFDVSVVKVSGHDVEVLSSEGVQRLGGKDFDDKLISLVHKKYKDQYGKNADLQKLEFGPLEAEEAKKTLSKRDTVKVKTYSDEHGRIILEITKKEFEDSISSYIAQAEMLCESALEEANVTINDIDEVFLVGGSSRIPAVKESVERVFAKEAVSFVNPDEVVALGAALYAAYKADNETLNSVQSNAVSKIKIQEIASHYFGMIAIHYNEERGEEVMGNTIIVKKGEKIPCSKTETFFTNHAGQQEVAFKVTQSSTDESDPRFVKIINEAKMSLPPDRDAGKEIKVTYSYTDNETMRCHFIDVESNKETEEDIPLSGEQSSVDKFLVD